MGIILYENLEVGYVPKTPAQPYFESSLLDYAKQTLLQYAAKYGHPISYIQEQQGSLIQNIVPVHKTETQQISTSSKVELGLHTETAFHPYKPDYVMLLCLRGEHKAVTTYANLSDTLKQLDIHTRRVLKQKWFTTGIDISFRTNKEPDQEIPISIVGELDGMLTLTYDELLVKGINDLAKEALQKIGEAIKNCTQEIVLKTGDLVVIDNNKTIHGRKPFQPRYDGTDRWVQRMLVRKQMPPDDQVKGNVITTKFG